MRPGILARASHSTLVTLLLAAGLAGCEQRLPVQSEADTGTLVFHFQSDQANVAAITITVTGPGISPALVATVHNTPSGGTDTMAVRAGSNRAILVSAFDSGGALAYQGDTTVTVVPGPNPMLTMVLQPLSGGLPIVITLNPGSATWTLLAAGAQHACGLTTTGATYCWGEDSSGILGDGGNINRPAPVLVAGGLAFTNLASGYVSNCGLTSAGLAYCWGWNTDGGLGDGTTTSRSTPVVVAGGLTFTSVVGGAWSMCGLTSSGAAYCWGDNSNGQVGDGSTTNRLAPTAVAGGLAFTSLAKNYLHTCGLTGGGVAYCWGWNVYGQLGDSSTTDRSTPVKVSGGLTFVSLTAGYYHTCGITTGGATYCWGENLNSQLGTAASMSGCFDGYTSQPCISHPALVQGGLSFTRLTAANATTCAVTGAGIAYCWGLNQFGEVGDGSTTNRSAPTAVAGGLTFASLTGGSFDVCGVASGGAAYCWGDNSFGQVGDGTTTNRSTPTAVARP